MLRCRPLLKQIERPKYEAYQRKPHPGVYVNTHFESQARNPYKQLENNSSADNLMQDSLFTPEQLGLKEFALNLNRLVHFGYGNEEILSRYASRALELVPSMKSRDIAMTMNSFSKSGHTSNSDLFEAYVKVIPSRLIHFTPLEIGLTLNSLSKLVRPVSVDIKPLLKRITDEIPHKLDMFAADSFSQTCHALAKLEAQIDRLLVHDLCKYFVSHVNEFSMQGLCMVLNALGRLGCDVPGNFWTCIFQEITDREEPIEKHWPPVLLVAASHSTGCQERSNFAEKMANLSVKHKIGIREISMTLSSLARMNYFDSKFEWLELMSVALQSLQMSTIPVKNESIVQLMQALGKRAITDDQSISLARKCIDKLNSSNSFIETGLLNDLAVVAYAMKQLKLQRVHKEFLNQIALRAMRTLSTGASHWGSTYATLSYAFAGEEISRSETLYHLISRGLTSTSLSAKSIGMALVGFSHKGAIGEGLKSAFAEQLRRLLLEGKLTPEESKGVLDGARSVNWSIDSDSFMQLKELIKRRGRKRDRILDGLSL